MSDDQVLKIWNIINDCIKDYGLINNPAIDEELIRSGILPNKSNKILAVIIATYHREAINDELKNISDQPAGIIRELRKKGFVFKDDGKNNNKYYYINSAGQTCRQIIGYGKPSIQINEKVKSIIEKSIAACVSSIEIYNKPDFKYREETFSILLINAWELLLKAKIILDNKNNLISIQAADAEGKTKKNRSGNPLTIDIKNALNRLCSEGKIDQRCKENIELLIEIRDNAIHFINKDLNFSTRVQEIGTAGLQNYVIAINDWFGWNLKKYNFFLMPMTFHHLTEIDSFSLSHHDKQINNMLKYFNEVEESFPPDEDNPYSISLRINLRFIKTNAPSILEVRYTDRDDAPEIRVSEENVFKNRYPLTYNKLTEKLKNRYIDFKPSRKFHDIKKQLETQDKYCKTNFLNVIDKKGVRQKFYSLEILKEFDKHYTKKESYIIHALHSSYAERMDHMRILS